MSYFEAKALREEKKGLVTEYQGIAKKATPEAPLSAEDIQRCHSINDAIDVLDTKIATAECVERSEAMVITSTRPANLPATVSAGKVITRQDQANAFRAWVFKQQGLEDNIRSEHYAAAEKVGLNLNRNTINVRLLEDAPENLADIRRDTMTTAITNDANTFNNLLIRGVETALKSWGNMTNACQIIRTENGNTLPFVTEDDTANVGQLRQKAEVIGSDALAPGRVSFGAWSIGSGIYPVPVETLEDTGIDMQSMIGKALGTRIARAANALYTNGVGTTQPTGLATAVAPTLFYPNTGNVDWYDVLVQADESIDDGYKDEGDFGYMFHKSVRKDLRLLVDALGRPLWQASLTVGEPDRLNGYPYWINNDLAVGTLYCGNFKKFVIRQVRDVSISVLRERFAEYNAVAFVANWRVDSGCINTAAFKAATVCESASFVNCGNYPSNVGV